MPQSFEKNKSELCIYLLGSFKIRLGTKHLELPTRKAELLLAYLILNPGEHSREKLAALLWGDSSTTDSRNSLRNALALVNKIIGPGLFIADRQTVELNPDYPLWVDAHKFQTQATELLTEPAPNPEQINFDLYQGDLLTDYYDDWIFPFREQYLSLLIKSLLLIMQNLRSQSEYDGAIEYANKVLLFDPANERAHQHLMFCFMAQGNRIAALQQYEICQSVLWEELAVEPTDATVALYEWIRQAPEEIKPFAAQITNLPIPLTSFVGRKQEMADVKQFLSNTRLFTITGTGGSGKTRLAIQVASDLIDAFKDGVWWVDLSSLTDGSLLPQKIAQTLGVKEVASQPLLESLVHFLFPKHLLLMIDNCEQLVSDCAHNVNTLLEACPQLKVITTSREPLNILGEQVWHAPTLSLPDPQSLPPADQTMDYESIRLFVERALAVRSDFVVTEQNAPVISQICLTLDGIPLAIELAAARVRAMTLEEILSRLSDRFQLLKGGNRAALPRHQTLQAAIDWSYDLLSEQERILLRRLAVFAGGWSLQAAEEICSGKGLQTDAILDLLTNLVDKSLVVREDEPKGTSRYRFLETIRQYANQKLMQFKEENETSIRHLNYYADLVDSAQPHLGFFLPDLEILSWLQVLEPEQDNLRMALTISQKMPSTTETGLRMAGMLHWFWLIRSQFTEGRSWLEELLEKGNEVSKSVQAQGYLSAGFLACWQGSFASARGILNQCLELFRSINNRPGTAFSLNGLGFAANGLGDHDLASSLFEECLEIARAIDDKWLISFALHFLAIGNSFQGNLELAHTQFGECIHLIQDGHGNLQGIAFSLFHLGRIARLQGNYPLASQHYTEAIKLFWRLGDRRGIGYSLSGLACLALAQEEPQKAAHLFGVFDSIRSDLGALLEEILQKEYDRAKTVTRELLGEDKYQTAWSAGGKMSLAQTVDNILKEENS
ncbi:MAG: tetratricopeptide repeat protein [Anaerolineales bacterium]